MTNIESLDIIVIGGGISGIYILDHLLSSNPQTKNLKIKLFEKRNSLGGRIKTIYEKDDQVKFEAGSWRFHINHSRIKKLIEKYHLPYLETTSSLSKSFLQEIDYCQTSQNKKLTQKKKSINSLSVKFPTVAGLSMMDNKIYHNNYCSYKDEQLFHSSPKLMDSTNIAYCIQNENQGNHYFLSGGFSQLVQKISSSYYNHISLNSIVEDVMFCSKEQVYQLKIKINNEIKEFKTRYLFFCLPPHFVRYWTISKLYLKPLIFSVDTMPINHLYGYDSNLSNFHQNKFQIFTSSSLDQIISGNYQNNWFQVAYTSGMRADFWKHIIQLFPEKVTKIINQTLNKMNIKLKISDYYQCYTEKAVHYWNSNYGFNLEKNVLKSIYPDPVNLPGLFWAGEAFSSNQGWIEGALETSELALNQFYQVFNHQYHFYPITLDNTFEYMILDNRVLDVAQWKKVHPGSIQSINNHLHEDISQLFRMINHKEYSWAIVLNLQKYWAYQGQIGYFK